MIGLGGGVVWKLERIDPNALSASRHAKRLEVKPLHLLCASTYTPSRFFKISSTNFGFALPAESFITAPLSALIAFGFPVFTCSTERGSAAMAASHQPSSCPVSVD